MSSSKQLALKPQDLLVALKLAANSQRRFTYAELSDELGISTSEVHSAVRRGLTCRLLTKSPDLGVVRFAMMEFLTHGVQYVFPFIGGSLTRGMPTTFMVPPLNRHFPPDELPYVWPHPEGETRGLAFHPLYPTVVFAAMMDSKLYEMLALVDAIRGGQARDREISKKLLEEYFI